MGLPKDIENLVERFDRNRETYLAGQYNKALLRQDFLNPLFEALGWDMANKRGASLVSFCSLLAVFSISGMMLLQ